MVAGIMQELIPNSLVNYTDYQKKMPDYQYSSKPNWTING